MKVASSDPYEHDFQAADYSADDLEIKLTSFAGASNAKAKFFDDGPVLREEILCEIKSNATFQVYQLV